MNEINPMYTPMGTTNINYTTNASRQYPTHRVTRTIAQPIVVSREDLIKNLAGASDAYKKAMLDTRDLGTAIGSAVDSSMVEKMLSTPQNKGRLESELPIESALMGGLLKGFQAYNQVSNAKLAQEKENYLNFLKQVEMEDAMRAREEAAAAKNAELNKTTVEDVDYTEPVGGTYGSQQKAYEEAMNKDVERKSAAVTAADVWNTVDQHPNHFSEFAQNEYFGWMMPGDDRKRRGWVAQQAPQIGGVELQKLQDMMPKGFSGAINSAVEQRLMMPVREAMNSGIGSKIKPAIETYLGGYYDELQKEFAVQTGGQALPFTKEEFISDQLNRNPRQYNVDYNPSDPNKPMFKAIKKETKNNNEFYKNKYGATVVED